MFPALTNYVLPPLLRTPALTSRQGDADYLRVYNVVLTDELLNYPDAYVQWKARFIVQAELPSKSRSLLRGGGEKNNIYNNVT